MPPKRSPGRSQSPPKAVVGVSRVAPSKAKGQSPPGGRKGGAAGAKAKGKGKLHGAAAAARIAAPAKGKVDVEAELAKRAAKEALDARLPTLILIVRLPARTPECDCDARDPLLGLPPPLLTQAAVEATSCVRSAQGLAALRRLVLIGGTALTRQRLHLVLNACCSFGVPAEQHASVGRMAATWSAGQAEGAYIALVGQAEPHEASLLAGLRPMLTMTSSLGTREVAAAGGAGLDVADADSVSPPRPVSVEPPPASEFNLPGVWREPRKPSLPAHDPRSEEEAAVARQEASGAGMAGLELSMAHKPRITGEPDPPPHRERGHPHPPFVPVALPPSPQALWPRQWSRPSFRPEPVGRKPRRAAAHAGEDSVSAEPEASAAASDGGASKPTSPEAALEDKAGADNVDADANGGGVAALEADLAAEAEPDGDEIAAGAAPPGVAATNGRAASEATRLRPADEASSSFWRGARGVDGGEHTSAAAPPGASPVPVSRRALRVDVSAAMGAEAAASSSSSPSPIRTPSAPAGARARAQSGRPSPRRVSSLGIDSEDPAVARRAAMPVGVRSSTHRSRMKHGDRGAYVHPRQLSDMLRPDDGSPRVGAHGALVSLDPRSLPADSNWGRPHTVPQPSSPAGTRRGSESPRAVSATVRSPRVPLSPRAGVASPRAGDGRPHPRAHKAAADRARQAAAPKAARGRISVGGVPQHAPVQMPKPAPADAVLADKLRRNAAVAIVVLGNKPLNAVTATVDTISRVDVAVRTARQYPGSIVCFSGGSSGAPGVGSTSEALAMAMLAVTRGLERPRVLLEEKALSTKQNATLSYALLRRECPRLREVIVVSKDDHLEWALPYFHALGPPPDEPGGAAAGATGAADAAGAGGGASAPQSYSGAKGKPFDIAFGRARGVGATVPLTDSCVQMAVHIRLPAVLGASYNANAADVRTRLRNLQAGVRGVD